MALPTKFEDLDQKELYRSAIEDFAVAVEEKDSKKVLLAALLESGVKWKDYVAQHPEVKPVETTPTPPVGDTNVVTTDALEAENIEPVVVQPQRVRTAAPATYEQEDLYLVKMSRENPYFEFRGYKFTKKNPFVVMDAANTNAILTTETGFAIATPAEAQEYYA